MLYLKLDIPKVVLAGLNAPRGLYPRRVSLWIFSIEEITYAGLLALGYFIKLYYKRIFCNASVTEEILLCALHIIYYTWNNLPRLTK